MAATIHAARLPPVHIRLKYGLFLLRISLSILRSNFSENSALTSKFTESINSSSLGSKASPIALDNIE